MISSGYPLVSYLILLHNIVINPLSIRKDKYQGGSWLYFLFLPCIMYNVYNIQNTDN